MQMRGELDCKQQVEERWRHAVAFKEGKESKMELGDMLNELVPHGTQHE